jgi:hypothetical protein
LGVGFESDGLLGKQSELYGARLARDSHGIAEMSSNINPCIDKDINVWRLAQALHSKDGRVVL